MPEFLQVLLDTQEGDPIGKPLPDHTFPAFRLEGRIAPFTHQLQPGIDALTA